MIYLIVAGVSVLITVTGIALITTKKGQDMKPKTVVLLVVAALVLLFIGWKIATDGAHQQCGKNDFADSVECP